MRMALSIKDPEADRLARQVAQLTAELLKIGERCAQLPELEARSPEETIGYDEHGLPR